MRPPLSSRLVAPLRLLEFPLVVFPPFALALFALATAVSRADDPAGADGGGPAVAPPAADGTRSVVVPEGAAPVADPPAAAPPFAASTPPDPVPEPGPAATLLAEVLEPPAPPPGTALAAVDTALFARPLTLLEAVQRPGDASRRLWVTQAYWKVSVAYAQVRWSAEAIGRLELVAPGADPHDRATLDVATAAARADLADARVQLGVAQQDLVDLARLPLGEPLPWPVDRPLAGPYQTHFETIFAARVATGRVRAIARTLALRHEALESRATAVRAAAQAVAMAEADHAKGRRPIEAVIAAHAALVGQQRDFLGAARAYNVDIAEYAMAVADATVPDDRFVSMLIGTPIQWRPQPVAPATLGPGTPEAVTPAQATLPE